MNKLLIKKTRKQKGMKQEEIARLINITLRNYQQIENHEVVPNVITALQICKLLCLNPFEVYL